GRRRAEDRRARQARAVPAPEGFLRRAGRDRTELGKTMVYTISTAFAIYFVLWWIVLFLTLPFGVRSQHEDGVGAPGTDPGAPIATQMGRKLIWTTVISAVIFGLAMLAYNAGYLSIDRLAKLMGMAF